MKMLKKSLITWERTLRNSISPFSKDADLIRQTLVKKIKELRQELKRRMSKGVVETTRYKLTLQEMEKAYPIKKKGLLIKSGIALIFILVLFFVQSMPEIRRLSLGWSALIGIIFLLIISERDDMDAILHRVEWPTLLFFAGMFVLMESVERMGFITWIGSGTESLIKGVSKDYRLAVAVIIILWVSALTSAFVESLPVTQMMVKIVISLAANPKLGLPLQVSYLGILLGNLIKIIY
jgi:P protein